MAIASSSPAPASGRLQPMLIDLDVDRVLRRPRIIGPDIALAEAHAVERLRRQARSVVGELLGIGEGPAQTLDDSAAAADLDNQALTYSPGSCEQYLNARFEKKTVFFEGWLSGWISAHNRLMPDTYSLIPGGDEQLEAQLKALEDWCQLHPLRDFVD